MPKGKHAQHFPSNHPPPRPAYRLLRYPFFFRLGASLGFDANGRAAWSFFGTGSALNLRGFRSIGLYRESYRPKVRKGRK